MEITLKEVAKELLELERKRMVIVNPNVFLILKATLDVMHVEHDFERFPFNENMIITLR